MTTTTTLGRIVAGLLLVGLMLAGRGAAAFTNSFDDVTAGETLSLKWDEVEPHYYPLCITARLVERAEDGHTATAYKANVTLGVNVASFSWAGVPYPLRHAPNGMYQLELHPVAGEPSLLAKSPFFSIKEKIVSPSPSPSPAPGDHQSGGTSGVNRPLAIGLGVAIGIPSVVALALVSWCFRKRQRRATMEKRRRNRRDFIIN